MSVELHLECRDPLPPRDGGWTIDVGPVRVVEKPGAAPARLVVSSRAAAGRLAEEIAEVLARATRGRITWGDGEGARVFDAADPALGSAQAIEGALFDVLLVHRAQEEARQLAENNRFLEVMLRDPKGAAEALDWSDVAPAAEAAPATPPTATSVTAGELAPERVAPFAEWHEQLPRLEEALRKVWQMGRLEPARPILNELALTRLMLEPEELAALVDAQVPPVLERCLRILGEGGDPRALVARDRKLYESALIADHSVHAGRAMRGAFEAAFLAVADHALDDARAAARIRDALGALDRLDDLEGVPLPDTEATAAAKTGLLEREAEAVLDAARASIASLRADGALASIELASRVDVSARQLEQRLERFRKLARGTVAASIYRAEARELQRCTTTCRDEREP